MISRKVRSDLAQIDGFFSTPSGSLLISSRCSCRIASSGLPHLCRTESRASVASLTTWYGSKSGWCARSSRRARRAPGGQRGHSGQSSADGQPRPRVCAWRRRSAQAAGQPGGRCTTPTPVLFAPARAPVPSSITTFRLICRTHGPQSRTRHATTPAPPCPPRCAAFRLWVRLPTHEVLNRPHLGTQTAPPSPPLEPTAARTPNRSIAPGHPQHRGQCLARQLLARLHRNDSNFRPARAGVEHSLLDCGRQGSSGGGVGDSSHELG